MVEFKVLDIGYEPIEKKKILVVDDDPSLQSLITDTLSDDYRLIQAYTGREAVKKAENATPELILMDMMMPDMGGYEAVRLLAAEPLTKNIPVIIITGKDFESSTVQHLKTEGNVVAFIPKPFRPKQLRDVIKSILTP